MVDIVTHLDNAIKSDSLQSTGQSGDGSGGGEHEADEVSPTRRPLGVSPKIHGGKVEELSPELQKIITERKAIVSKGEQTP